MWAAPGSISEASLVWGVLVKAACSTSPAWGLAARANAEEAD